MADTGKQSDQRHRVPHVFRASGQSWGDRPGDRESRCRRTVASHEERRPDPGDGNAGVETEGVVALPERSRMAGHYRVSIQRSWMQPVPTGPYTSPGMTTRVKRDVFVVCTDPAQHAEKN